MIPSIRLCGHSQLEYLADNGFINYRAVSEMSLKKSDCEWANIVLLGRSDSWYDLQLAKYFQKKGCYLIYIIDDDLLDVPDTIKSSSYYRQNNVKYYIKKMIEMCDALLSPSPILLDKYRHINQKKILIEEPSLIPVDFKPHQTDAPVKIGFAGSVDRAGDLDVLLKDALMAIKKEYKDKVQFEFFGAIPEYASDLNANCLQYCDSYEKYRKILNQLEWDIGLAPMPYTSFHSCKHYNKFCEYSAAGIVGIYSAVPPYTRIKKFPECWVLCDNTTETWIKSIKLLIEDRSKRERLRERACNCAKDLLSVKCTANTLFQELRYINPLKHDGDSRICLPYLKINNIVRRLVNKLKSDGLRGLVYSVRRRIH